MPSFPRAASGVLTHDLAGLPGISDAVVDIAAYILITAAIHHVSTGKPWNLYRVVTLAEVRGVEQAGRGRFKKAYPMFWGPSSFGVGSHTK